MSHALSEEEKQYIQRFDTPSIRDFDFPPDSGDRAMPYETPAAAGVPPAATPTAAGEPPAATPVIPSAAAVVPEEKPGGLEQASTPAQPLDPTFIPKFLNQLTKPPVCCPASRGDDEYLYVIDILQFKQQILPEGFPETTVLGYGGNVMDEETRQLRYAAGTPGATIEAVRNMPVSVRWVNKLSGPDSVPVVTHLHGARISQSINGHPDAWTTSDGKAGPKYRLPLCTYPNNQDAAALWYHDNARGFSKANIYAGLTGFYLLRSGTEFGWQRDGILPRGRYEIPLVIQDRSFNTDGSLSSASGDKSLKRDAAFFGNTITVNGKVWPNLNVERQLYRFRLLNGSGARVYTLRFSSGMAFIQIGTDSGFLSEPKTVDSLRLSPEDSADVLVDFSGMEPGTSIILINDARSLFSTSDAADPETTGQVMQFTVPFDAPAPVIPKKLPKRLK